VTLDHEGPQDLRAPKAPLDLPEQLEAKVNVDQRAKLVRKVLLVSKALVESAANVARTVLTARLALKALRARSERLAFLD